MTLDPATAAAAVDVQDLQLDVSATLTDLHVLSDLVQQIVDTRQRGLGFLTPDARMAQDQMMRAERRSRVDTEKRHLGLAWMRGTPATHGTGHITGAGNPTALSVDADITFTLIHLATRCVRALARAGVCALHQLPGEPTTADHIAHLRALAWASPSPPLLTSIQRELNHLVEAATFVVDGNDRLQLGDCPHCGKRTSNTLVVYFKTGVVRCDRDPRTGHYAPCTCRDDYCACKHKPVSHRHEWHRDKGAARDGWWALSDLINHPTK